MYQITTRPVFLLCQRMSALPSLSKSAEATGTQDVGGGETPSMFALDAKCGPFMNQIWTRPVLELCHMMSALPSMFASGAANGFHAVDGEPTPSTFALPRKCTPF